MKTQLRIASMSLLALVLLALAITPSFASSIPVFSTGAGLSNSGQTDPNYKIISAPSGAPPPGQALTTPGLGYVAAPSGTQWVNSWGYDNGNTPSGTYDYQTTFDLTGLNPGTAELTGFWAADDTGYILLNGVAAVGLGTVLSDPGFRSLTAFDITGGFHAGVNTLDFMVTNDPFFPGDGIATGLLVSISGTASPTPEPSSLLLMGSGLLGLAAVVRRKLMG